MTSAASQLRLPFPYRPGFAAADFMAAPSNEGAVAWLASTRDWPDQRLLLWGDAGCGKTHLLHVWVERTGAALVSGPTLHALGTPPPEGIAIDDADLTGDETGLFHLLNSAREAGLPVLLAARTPPARWSIRLPDLASRLRSVMAIEIAPPEDSLLQALLARLLADRQLAVQPSLQAWLLLRLPRTAAALREAVARLDADGRPIDRVLAGSVLADLTIAGAPSHDTDSVA